MIAILQEKLSCKKVGAATILKVPARDYSNSKHIQYFRGGKLKNHLTKCKNVTSNKIILDTIKNGLKLNLVDTPKSNSKFAFALSHEEEIILKKEPALLKGKNIVAKANVSKNCTFVPRVFTRSKKDGSKQVMLNLKKLNKFVKYKHLKWNHYKIY